MRLSIPKDKRRNREESARLVEEWIAQGNEVKKYDYAIRSESMKDGVNKCGICKTWKPVSAFAMLSHPGQSRCVRCVAMHSPIKSVRD